MATPASWTSSNGLSTVGTMNPGNLKKNDPNAGFMGATPAPAASPAPTPAPAATGMPAWNPGASYGQQPAAGATSVNAQTASAQQPPGAQYGQQGQQFRQQQRMQPQQQWGGGGMGGQRSAIQAIQRHQQAPMPVQGPNRPPDQMGVTGTPNADTGLTDYGSGDDLRSMDSSGNWFNGAGESQLYDQAPIGGGEQSILPSEQPLDSGPRYRSHRQHPLITG